MTVLFALVALTQGVQWEVAPRIATVGDTVAIERFLAAPDGSTARTETLTASELFQPLGPPEVVRRVRGLVVRHRVAMFAPGFHRVAMPAVELVAPDGRVEMVAGDSALVEIAAVIPDSIANPQPKWSLGPLGRPARRIEPLLVLTAVVVAGLGTWGIARRRTRPPVTADPEVVEPGPGPPFMRWLASGETRAVATLATETLRARMAEVVQAAGRAQDVGDAVAAVAAERPDWPIDELEDSDAFHDAVSHIRDLLRHGMQR